MDKIEAFLSNTWTITFFGGVGVALACYLAKILFNKYNNLSETVPNFSNSNQQTVINNIFAPDISQNEAGTSSVENRSSTLSSSLKLKESIRILFIEDGKFKQINNLKSVGWSVSQIKDIKNLDSVEVRDANIIFVDYKGVGGKLSDEEGVGIVRALKDRYGKQKWVIFYSAHPVHLNIISGNNADAYLAKNSTLIEFEQKIIEGIKNIN